MFSKYIIVLALVLGGCSKQAIKEDHIVEINNKHNHVAAVINGYEVYFEFDRDETGKVASISEVTTVGEYHVSREEIQNIVRLLNDKI